MNILRKMNIVFATKQRPIDKIPDDLFHPLSPRAMVILFLFQTGYAAVHLSGWNFHFPSPIERLLWQIATLVMTGSIVAYWVVDLFAWHIHPALKRYIKRDRPKTITSESNETSAPNSSCLFTKLRPVAANLRNNSPGHDPSLTVPLKAIIPLNIIAVCYCFARAYIILEDFVNLRAQPSSAYVSIRWSAFLPHFR